ncbi:hypothetical protein SAMN03159463_05300 [Mesorhizobium sp. NFR06]|uniref:hypothetical protein n=1 Tax=Mesorhizobium sp. NFR06 TaxID=1566290 RepID=UPI0008F3C558|nr:hypothetical protein [Mesorhizobium sp. NFR06]SFP97940.1 hypothetical protein SAMN03159463_05300 [Mesorhizobium sp. NFR06]
MTKSPAKARKSAIPAAPTWMNTTQKREYSALLALENGWKGFATDVELHRLGDLVDIRGRITGMRRLMRAAMRAKDVGLVISLNNQINASIDKAHRLEELLRLQQKQKTAAEYSAAARTA